MTDGQKKFFYFPAWYACCRANGWRMQKGCLLIDAEALSEEGRKAFVLAKQRALADGRAVTLEDLRHGAHIVALGRDKSSKHFTNKEVDRVVCLFHVLEDPDWLGDERRSGLMHWLAYQRGEDPGALRRVDWFIKHTAPEAYVRAISADKFGTPTWENLTPGQKEQLARTLNERRRAKARPVQGHQTKMEDGGSKMASRPAASGQRNYQLNPQLVFTKGPF